MALLSRRTAARPRLVRIALLIGVAFGLAGPGAARAQAPEYEVKAAFLYNFTKFVEWPPSAFAEGNGALRICVLGEDPFGRNLQTVAGEEVEGHRLTVVSSGTLAKAGGCQVSSSAARSASGCRRSWRR